MSRFRVALGCLTILPVGPQGTVPPADLGGSFAWFPLVGLLVGAALAGIPILAAPALPPLVVGAWVLLAWVLLTGALHLDGVGDVADGLYAGRTPADRLRIMKDPHIGAVGVVAVTLVLILKFALLSSLPSAALARAVLVVPCLGRYVMVVLGTTLPYARAEDGTAAAFVRHGSPRALAPASLVAGLAAGLAFGARGLWLIAVGLAGSLLLRAGFRRALGGITGDALGAAGEVSEVLLLAAIAAMAR